MDPAVERLTGVVDPPSDPPAVDWGAAADALGLRPPNDYVDLIDTYGGGQFDGYLYLAAPFSPNGFYDLVALAEERASTDDGEYLYWVVRPGADPDTWTVLVGEGRGPGWEHHPTGCARFLLDWLTGEVRSTILSSDHPTTPHTFESFGD